MHHCCCCCCCWWCWRRCSSVISRWLVVINPCLIRRSTTVRRHRLRTFCRSARQLSNGRRMKRMSAALIRSNDTRSYSNVRSKADTSQLSLPRGSFLRPDILRVELLWKVWSISWGYLPPPTPPDSCLPWHLTHDALESLISYNIGRNERMPKIIINNTRNAFLTAISIFP